METIDSAGFWAKVKKADGCWLWIGPRQPTGYGAARLHGKAAGAHRVAWMLTYGEIPNGLKVCHHCDNPPCVRPDHLFLGTQKDNMQDAIAKGRFSFNPVPKQRGEGHSLAKFSDLDVLTILGSFEPAHVLADRYGVCHHTIRDVRRRKTWRHIEGPVAYHGGGYRKRDMANLPRGGAHYRAKLTELQVREIRASKETLMVLGLRYGVSLHAIHCVRTRKSWAHVL